MQSTIDLIKKFESFKPKPYYATENERKQGKLTIGYGFTYIDNKKINPDLTLTEREAETILIQEITKIFNQVKNHLPNLNNNKIGAITSMCYNLGTPAVLDSTLVKKLKANQEILINIDDYQRLKKDITLFSDRKDYKEVLEYSEFHRWIYQSGKALYGLFARREAEYQLFKKG